MGVVGEAVELTEYAVLSLYFCTIVFPQTHDGDRKLQSTQNNTNEQDRPGVILFTKIEFGDHSHPVFRTP